MRQTPRRGAVGGFELLILCVVLFGSILSAAYAGQEFGWLGLIGGGPIGVVLPFGVLMLLISALAFAEALAFSGVPYLPTCRSGKCGQRHWGNRADRRVLEVLDDGTTNPYMVWRSFRGWYPDQECNHNDTQPATDI